MGNEKAVGEMVEKPEFRKEGTKLYFVGCFENSPRQTIHVGGVQFPLYTQKIVPTDNNVMMLSPEKIPGDIMELYPEQVENIKELLKHKYVRWSNVKDRKGRAEIVDYRDKAKWRPERGDVPLAEYLYMMEVSSVDGFNRNKMMKPLSQIPLG